MLEAGAELAVPALAVGIPPEVQRNAPEQPEVGKVLP